MVQCRFVKCTFSQYMITSKSLVSSFQNANPKSCMRETVTAEDWTLPYLLIRARLWMKCVWLMVRWPHRLKHDRVEAQLKMPFSFTLMQHECKTDLRSLESLPLRKFVRGSFPQHFCKTLQQILRLISSTSTFNKSFLVRGFSRYKLRLSHIIKFSRWGVGLLLKAKRGI